MSEAYEIGVTLALGDGVSAGLAQARKDTAQLERVLLAGGVSVQQLRAASMLALSATRAVPRLAKEAEKAPVLARPEESAPVAAGPVSVPAWVRHEDAPRPAASAAEPAAFLPREVVGAAVAAVPARVDRAAAAAITPPGLAPRPTLAETAVQAPQSAPRALPNVPQVSAPISLATIGLAARSERPVPAQASLGSEPSRVIAGPRAVGPAVAAPERPVGDPVSGGGETPRVWEQVPLSARIPLGGSEGAGEAGRVAAGPVPQASRAERLFSSPQDGGEAGPVPQAPAAVKSFPAPQGSGEAGAGSQAPAAPPPNSVNSGPVEGDVFLDGALVGRWMSRLLSQEAGRASAGPTGFDPRRNRLLPGATVGA